LLIAANRFEHYRRWHAFDELAAKKETSMANAILIREANFSSATRTTRRDKTTGGRAGRRTVDQSLFGGLLDPKSSSLSLSALAQAAAFSGKRLVLEIRDENPVKIIRTSTRGM
jgi:hypothetical protein